MIVTSLLSVSAKGKVTNCAAGVQESVAVTFSENDPLPVGVPLNKPADESAKPAGMLAPVQVSGSKPPCDWNWKL